MKSYEEQSWLLNNNNSVVLKAWQPTPPDGAEARTHWNGLV